MLPMQDGDDNNEQGKIGLLSNIWTVGRLSFAIFVLVLACASYGLVFTQKIWSHWMRSSSFEGLLGVLSRTSSVL